MRIKNIVLLGLVLCSHSYAADISINGTIEQTISLPANASQNFQASEPKTIKLLNIELSDEAIKALQARAKTGRSLQATKLAAGLPSSKQLGMNGVPVLDQGSHGSCATFANVAALDAALGQGDYISSLCLLQLGNYLQEHSFSESGWDGSLGRSVMGRLDTFGLVSQAKQKTVGCGGLREYPLKGEEPQGSISVDDYHTMAEGLLAKGLIWSPILDAIQSLTKLADTELTVSQIKKALFYNTRVTVGVMLADTDLGIAGAVGKNKIKNDSWVLTAKIKQDLLTGKDLAGHEMVITGYDDNAVAIDSEGIKHKGLFSLRNSWGKNAGDHGDFYISYDYFKIAALEAQQIFYVDVKK